MRTILKVSLCALTLILGASVSAQNGKVSLKGRTISTDGTAVGYATVVLVDNSDSTHTHGAATDDTGAFELKVPRGEYLFRTSFLGYKPIEKNLSLDTHTDLGDLTLEHDATEIDAVVVKAEMIVREADRFVVNVAGNSQAIGRTAKEMLEISPGVWVDERNGVYINGKSNPQVYVNDLLIRETGEDLVNYLQTIKAEDIQKIEVIPTSGVEYDADSQGGVIKITLKKQRENGLEGSVSMRYSHSIGAGTGRMSRQIQPSFNLNYMHNKFRFYTTVSESNWKSKAYINTDTRYENGDDMKMNMKMKMKNDWPSLRAGTIYEINPRHSVGVEANLRGFFPGRADNHSYTSQSFGGNVTEINQYSDGYFKNKNMNLTANYIAKIDTVGSTFKLLLDYYRSERWEGADLDGQYTGFITKDSTYKSRGENLSKLYSVTGDFEIKAGKASKISTGFKYSYRDLDATSRWEYKEDGTWIENNNPGLTFDNGYTENIAALYGSFATTFRNKWSLKAGLRGEYTYATPQDRAIGGSIPRQDYFSLFPNANLMIPLSEKMTHMLVLNYARKINRPWYSSLIPTRQPISDNLVSEGNPNLKPAYANDASISYVFKQKYNLTVGMQYTTDAIGWTVAPDPEDESILVEGPQNLDNTQVYYTNLNIPVEVTKWWKINTNVMAIRMESLMQDGYKQRQWTTQGSVSNVFTLCKNLTYNIDFRGQGTMAQANLKMLPQWRIDNGLRYSFKKNMFTATLYMNDVLNTSKQRLIASSPGSFRTDARGRGDYRRLGVSLRYNFKSGKAFKARTVETGEGNEGSGGGGGGIGGGGGGGM